MGQGILIKKVSTFKSGNFVFSRKFSLRKLQPLRIESRILFRAGLIHYYLGLIHPFGDGNGRIARWVEAYLLQLSGIKYVPIMP